jgi:hypothetical protein
VKTGTVQFSDLGKTGRMDAGFHLLLAAHRPLYDELMAKFSREELVQLALALPYDRDAARAVAPEMTTAENRGEAYFRDTWLGKWAKKKSAWPRQHSDLAVYCAAASQQATSKVLEGVLAQRKEQLEKVRALKSLWDLAAGKGAKVFQEAIVRGTVK